MKRQRIAGLVFAVVGAATLVSFQNCSKTNFNTSPETLTSLGFGVVQPPPAQTICGAFDANGTNDANCDVAHAFVGNLFVEPRDQLVTRSHGGYAVQAGAGASIAALSQLDWLSGKTVDGVFKPYTIVATSFDTVGNPFTNGFVTQAGDTVTIPDADGKTTNVAAWFSFRVEGLFHLDAHDTPDEDYQIAVFADDGAQVSFKPAGANDWQMLVDDQTPESVKNPGGYIPGTQYTRMGCAAVINDPSTIRTFKMSAKQTVPLRLAYYQGPIGLSLRLMYRRVPAAGANDSFCETDVNGDAKTKSIIVKASPRLDVDQLADHGWKVIGSENLGSL